jgi:hypothetical protein
MALQVSSLSVALQGFADYLDTQFDEDVVVSLDAPQKAAEAAKGQDKHVLNVFAYRLAPSGVHAGAGFQDALFLRAHLLLTCFAATQGDPAPDTDLRVLGHAISALHSVPTIPVVLPGPATGPATGADTAADDFRRRTPVMYQMQAILQAPTMEEMNHIWTTQGGELAYRLSIAYELALIPIEPQSVRPPTRPVRSAIIDVSSSARAALAPDGQLAYGAEASGIALSGALTGPDATRWIPLHLFASADALSSTVSVPPGTQRVDLALAGPLGERAAISLTWTRAAGGGAQTDAPQTFVIAAQRIDDPAGRVQISLSDAAPGDTAVLIATAARQDGTILPDAPAGNVLTLTVGGPP